MMRLLALALVAALLGGLLWRELAVPASAPAVARDGRPVTVPTPSAVAADGAHDAARREREVAEILARPLFEASRRPAAVAHATAVAAAAVVPRVTGVLITSAARSAIFVLPGTDRPVVASEGGRVGAFTVQSIRMGQVTVASPDRTLVLRPSFAADGGAERAAPAAAPATSAAAAAPGLPLLPPGPAGRFGLPSLPGLPALPPAPGQPANPLLAEPGTSP